MTNGARCPMLANMNAVSYTPIDAVPCEACGDSVAPEDLRPMTRPVCAVCAARVEHLPRYVSDQGGGPFTLAAFREANEESPDVYDWAAELAALAVGASWALDCGAGGVTRFKRVV